MLSSGKVAPLLLSFEELGMIPIIISFAYISSSYAKILGETNIQPREFPRSGSKAKDVKEREKERERRAKVGNNNGQLRIANATLGGTQFNLVFYFNFI